MGNSLTGEKKREKRMVQNFFTVASHKSGLNSKQICRFSVSPYFWKKFSLILCSKVLILVIVLSSDGILFYVLGPR